MSLRSPLAKVRHLGSAKDGTAHWWAQRLTSLALVPLVLWFVVSVIALAGADHATVTAWIGQPLSASLLLLLIAALFYHTWLGVQVVIEDYVHAKGTKLALLLLALGACLLLGVIAAVSVLAIFL